MPRKKTPNPPDRSITPAAANPRAALQKHIARQALGVELISDTESAVAVLRARKVLNDEQVRAARAYLQLRTSVFGHLNARAALLERRPGRNLSDEGRERLESDYRWGDGLLTDPERRALQRYLCADGLAAASISPVDAAHLRNGLGVLASAFGWTLTPAGEDDDAATP